MPCLTMNTEYCHDHEIVPFIDLNANRGRSPVYKNDFTINDDGVPVCREGHAMRRDGTESAKERKKFKCPKSSFAEGAVWPVSVKIRVAMRNMAGLYTLS